MRILILTFRCCGLVFYEIRAPHLWCLSPMEAAVRDTRSQAGANRSPTRGISGLWACRLPAVEVSARPRECSHSQGPRATLIFQSQRTLGETSPSRVGLGYCGVGWGWEAPWPQGGMEERHAVPADGPRARARPSRSRDNAVDREAPFPAERGLWPWGPRARFPNVALRRISRFGESKGQLSCGF